MIKVNIKINNLNIVRTPHLQINLDRFAVINIATFHIADVNYKYVNGIKINDKVDIDFGYVAGDVGVFSGAIQNINAKKGYIEVSVVSNSYKLADTMIIESYNDESVNDIIKRIVEVAGFEAGKVEVSETILPHIVLSKISVYQCINQLVNTINLLGENVSDMQFWVNKNKFYMGDFNSPQLDKFTFKTGINIIENKTSFNGSSYIEAPLIPNITHSNKINIMDTLKDIKGEFMALSVKHSIINGIGRTIIEYRIN